MRIDDKTALYVNLAIGIFTTLANGAALAITLAGGRGALVDEIPEITVWIAAGLFLVCTSGYAVLRRLEPRGIVRVQALVLGLLVSWLALFAISLTIEARPAGQRISWQVGLLTGAAWYVSMLILNVFGGARRSDAARALAWAMVAACALIDFTVFLRGPA